MDLQQSTEFQDLGVLLLSVSPDSVDAWRETGEQLGLELPLLSDEGNEVAERYGVMQWRVGNEPGHTFVVVDEEGVVRSIRDYGAPENGGLMYVPVEEIVDFVRDDLGITAGAS